MYEESGCLDDPNAIMGAATTTDPSEEDCFSQMVSESVMSGTATQTHNSFPENVGLSMEINLPYNPTPPSSSSSSVAIAATAMEITPPHPHPQQMGGFHMENHQNLSFHQHQFSYPSSPPDLLNLLHLPRSGPASPYGNSSLSFENQTHTTTWLQQPITHPYPNMPPPPSRNDFVFGEGYDIVGGSTTGVGVVASYQDGRGFGNQVMEFTQQDVTNVGRKRGGRRTKKVTITSERERRVDLGSKFDALKDLIPNPTRNDRASVVGDAIEYIRELLRTVNALKSLAENKRQEKQRMMMMMMKRQKVVEEGAGASDLLGELEDSNNNNNNYSSSYNIESMTSSWIQRKSEETEVDVRIIEDEVTIKLVQRKKINCCLVHASRVLNEFKLDLQHVASGHVGDFCSFFINCKICEGSSVYASAIANKLIEVMDTSLAAVNEVSFGV